MRSRGEWRAALELACTAAAVGATAALLWSVLRPSAPPAAIARAVRADGTLDSLTVPRGDTVLVRLEAVPGARTRDLLAAWRAAGVALTLESPTRIAPLAIGVRRRHPLVGGSVVDVVAAGGASVSDAGGTLDSLGRSGSLVRLDAPMAVSAVAPGVRATAQVTAAEWPRRVLVAGGVSWEARFVTAALEEAGWDVDATFRVSPTVDVQQGTPRLSRARHAAVVVLDGAPASVVGSVPGFVRAGGGVVLVGEASRAAALSSVRAGVPGRDLAGEAGAEASSEPRRGLDAVTLAALNATALPIEARAGVTVSAARRVESGRVLQVGYENSWLWRMAGDASAPAAHRAWWSAMVASVVQAAPAPMPSVAPWADTLDAAPVAALADRLGLPAVRDAATLSARDAARQPPRIPAWLWLTIALAGWCGAWLLRRWQGLP